MKILWLNIKVIKFWYTYMVAMFVLCNSFHPENYNVLRDPPYISCTNDAKKRLKVNWTTVPKHLRFQRLVFFFHSRPIQNKNGSESENGKLFEFFIRPQSCFPALLDTTKPKLTFLVVRVARKANILFKNEPEICLKNVVRRLKIELSGKIYFHVIIFA